MVRAVGTRFNVYRQDDTVTVTVLEGRVEATSGVTPEGATSERADAHTRTPTGSASPERVQIGAGERARLRTEAPIQMEQIAHPERTVDWQTRRLVFEQTPLADVIAEFNRYSEVPLRVEDPGLAESASTESSMLRIARHSCGSCRSSRMWRLMRGRMWC
ncbi:MAG: hypothetical protein WDO56_25035 [Gammaproteobacteria bacterium]